MEFDVLYYAKSQKYYDIVNEIGEKEGELIRVDTRTGEYMERVKG